MGKTLNIPNHTNTMMLKDKAAPLVATKEMMPIKSNVTRLFNIICLFNRDSFLTIFAQSQASNAVPKLNKNTNRKHKAWESSHVQGHSRNDIGDKCTHDYCEQMFLCVFIS